jgi:galactonate dehydratase
MRVTEIHTLRLERLPNLLFVQVVTDDGAIGLGETFFGPRAVEAYVHETAAPLLLGQEVAAVEDCTARLRGYLGSYAAGAETRGRSALDLALWDLLGQLRGEPLFELLGGASRDAVPIYNTCAGPRYVSQRSEQSLRNWGLPEDTADAGRYEDLHAFMTKPAQLARDLLGEGISAMKVWPFDPFAEASGGRAIAPSELAKALRPLALIRAEVGDAIDLMVELHGLWEVPAAATILEALEEIGPRWVEDPVRAEDAAGLASLAAGTDITLAGGETLAGRHAYERLLEREALGVLIFDPGWCGGVSEARAVAGLAAARGVPVAPHDCTGPVGLTVGAHLSTAFPNAVVQETVRAFHRGWYAELVAPLPEIADGMIRAPRTPGLGTALRAEVREREDLRVVSSELRRAARGSVRRGAPVPATGAAEQRSR